MIDFNPHDGWLYEMHGGPMVGERFRVNAGMTPSVHDAPRLSVVQFGSDDSGVYVAELTGDDVSFGDVRVGVWRYVWVPSGGDTP